VGRPPCRAVRLRGSIEGAACSTARSGRARPRAGFFTRLSSRTFRTSCRSADAARCWSRSHIGRSQSGCHLCSRRTYRVLPPHRGVQCGQPDCPGPERSGPGQGRGCYPAFRGHAGSREQAGCCNRRKVASTAPLVTPSGHGSPARDQGPPSRKGRGRTRISGPLPRAASGRGRMVPLARGRGTVARSRSGTRAWLWQERNGCGSLG
jgi:hypothetical protein